MSNMLRKGKRIQAAKDNKEVKHRMKDIYRILSDLDDVAKEIIKNEPDTVIDENNIKEIASKYTDRTIEGLETMILLSKLHEAGKVQKENILKDEVETDS